MTTEQQTKPAATCRQCGYSLDGATTINFLCDECDDDNNNPFPVDAYEADKPADDPGVRCGCEDYPCCGH